MNLQMLKKEGVRKKLFIFLKIIFVLYTILMFWELFLGNYRTHTEYRSVNLTPFKTIWQYVSNPGRYNSETVFINLAANIIVFMPLGFFVPILKYWFRSLSRVLILGFLIILAAECIQYIFRVGIFDIDDLILNTIGVGLGYGFFKILTNPVNR